MRQDKLDSRVDWYILLNGQSMLQVAVDDQPVINILFCDCGRIGKPEFVLV